MTTKRLRAVIAWLKSRRARLDRDILRRNREIVRLGKRP